MEDLSKPSGISIPLFLKRKWEKQQRPQDPAAVCDDRGHQNADRKEDEITNDDNIGDNEQTKPAVWEPQLRLRPDQELTRDERNELSNRVFTTSELEERIWKTTVDMLDIQRQLYRGEEMYYEDTYNHGSVYKGWDAFVDMKDIGVASASSSGGTQTSSNRRVPTDSRWFSTSCKSVSRTKPPVPFPPPLIPQSNPSNEKLQSIPKQQQAATPLKASPRALSNSTTSAAATVATDSTTETGQSSSARIRQRTAASTSTSSGSATRRADKAGASGTSSTSKANSRPATPIGSGRNVDPGSTKKKRKSMTTTASSEVTPLKKINLKSSSHEMKRPKTPSATKTAAMAAGTPKRHKSDQVASTTKGGPKSFKSEKREGVSSSGNRSNKAETSTSIKREKEVETPVPRKRGRPRRKT